MIQKNYKISIEIEQDCITAWWRLRTFLHKIKNSEEYAKAKNVFIQLLFAQIPVELAENISNKLKTELPKATVVGMSRTMFALSEKEHSLTLGCCFFDEAEVTVLESTNCPCMYDAEGGEFGKKIAAMKNVRGVLVMCAGVTLNMSRFLDSISEGNEDIPFFGAMAGIFMRQSLNMDVCQNIFDLGEDSMIQYVIGEKLHETGIVLTVFAGENLHVEADSIFGWQALGKEMKTTLTGCGTGVAKIDGIPATDVYKKYLGVEADENFLENICEFPLVINRNGFEIARVPPMFDENGAIYFNGDVREGEKVRLTYGNPVEIIAETRARSEVMRRFSPEALLLYVCGNRLFFLKDEEGKEIAAYKRFSPELVEANGASEIYRYKGQGGLLNSALVAVGMREGDNVAVALGEDLPVDEHRDEAIPLPTRLAAFLNATTRELKESNRELKTLAADAQEASRAKSRFLSNMSHEIRTPINAILGMDEMILRECKDETILEYARNIQSATSNLLGLVNDILDFSKIEAGKMSIVPVEYAVSSVLNDLVNMIQKRAAKKGLELVVEAENTMPSVLFGDEIRIKQIITNILTNAVKYTEKGSVTLTVNFIKKDAENIFLRVAVKDTGIGIKKDDMTKLFSAFERIEEKRNRTIEGTGLGMNITERLLTLMGSKLEVESVYGEGSTFSFAVEQKVMNWDAMGDFEESYRRMMSHQDAYHEKFTAPKARILVVDDTVMNLTVVKGLLKQTKVQIDTAESGYECLHLVQKNHYDIIFLDHRMPGMDGIETLKHMQKLPHHLNEHTPCISLTANAVSGAREEYIAAGFDDYLTKPINSSQLELMMLKFLPEEKVTRFVEKENESAADVTPEETLPEWLTKAEGLNTADGVKHCGGNAAYIDALTVFAESIESGAEEIERYYESERWKDYTVKVHALKSTARVIGANELSAKARRLEDAGNSGYTDEIKRHTCDLLALYRSYAKILAPMLNADDNATDDEKPLIDDAALADAYETMKDMAASFDYDSMMFVFDELADYNLPTADAAKIHALRLAAQKPDWDKVHELLGA